ncbi:MAG: beta-lactamase family protein [Gammaproteobacteria bacterium]|jgi:CubicO group peptidase (beta-lactamase class C family)|nr:beta-lactamase family protein [Gammaproteobacteria bacterium]MBT5602165.1 beta-lactamase family protein [Gammaproteobacteria bacterium]MBT6246128.1 beta-lactamase family protein [Gammaproteobacteria bacterium]
MFNRTGCLTWLLMVAGLYPVQPLVFADALELVIPEQVGISSRRLARVEQVAQRYVDEQRVPGIVTLISRRGQPVQSSVLGQMGLDNDAPMQLDTLFRIFSMTKAITAVGALTLYEQGHFHLDDPVEKFIPELKQLKVFEKGVLVEARTAMTMHQLFTHMSGLSYGYRRDHPVAELIQWDNPAVSASSAEFIDKLARLPLRNHPGEAWGYSFASDVLGVVIERITGLSLAEFLSVALFEPLGMIDTGFAVPPDKLHRLASSHWWDEINQVVKLVQEPYDREQAYRVNGFDSGGSGLISTAPDYSRFLEMLRNGGRYGDKQILSPKLVSYMGQDHLPASITDANVGPDHDRSLGLGGGHGLGIGVYIDPVRRGVLSSKGELDWGGVAGTIFWLDPQEDVIVVSMIQLFASPWRLRDDLSVAVYQALTEIDE